MDSEKDEIKILKKQLFNEKWKTRALENELFYFNNSLTGKVANYLRVLYTKVPGANFIFKLLKAILAHNVDTHIWLECHYPSSLESCETHIDILKNYNAVLIDFDSIATKKSCAYLSKWKSGYNIKDSNNKLINPALLENFFAEFPYTIVLSRNAHPLPSLIQICSLALEQCPEASLIYCDGNIRTRNGKRISPFFKPAWSPDLLFEFDYISHCFLIKTEMIYDKLGNLMFHDTPTLYEFLLSTFALDAVPGKQQIHHIPIILYEVQSIDNGSVHHGIDAKIQRDVVARLLAKNNVQAKIESCDNLNGITVHYKLKENPIISIIIPTKDKLELLSRCVDGILSRTTYKSIELILVDNNSETEKAKQYFEFLTKEHGVKVLCFKDKFNYAAINNFAARSACGKFLLLLNNDVDVINAEWLDEMLSHAQRQHSGCVGAHLYYPNGSLQHAGVVGGVGGIAGHAHRGAFPHSPDPTFCRSFTRNVLAVTGACLLVKKDLYDKVGGLDEKFRVAYNDVDFCLKIFSLGYNNIITPQARLVHYESRSRGINDTPQKKILYSYEKSLLIKRWGRLLANDPYYNQNFSLTSENFLLASYLEKDMDSLTRTATTNYNTL
jgi:O-antigen biosynthesis protein